MLRQKINSYLKQYGTSKKFFAKKVGLSYSALNKFLSGEINFKEETENRVREYIESNGKVVL